MQAVNMHRVRVVPSFNVAASTHFTASDCGGRPVPRPSEYKSNAFCECKRMPLDGAKDPRAAMVA